MVEIPDFDLAVAGGGPAGYAARMSMTNVSVIEDALSLSPAERAGLARLLIESLEGDRRTDEETKAELAGRLAQLKSGEDPGFTFEDVFHRPA
jgi:putative addiction module component (TIGR02574 family)